MTCARILHGWPTVDGAMMHRDSTGVVQRIERRGQLDVGGRGIVHSEAQAKSS